MSPKKPAQLQQQQSVEITEDTPNCPQELIEEARRLVLKDFEDHPELYEEPDITRLKESDWLVTRFLLRKKCDVEAASQMMINTARWRKELSMCQWKDQDFPEEMYKIGGVFPYARDLKGNTCLYLRIRLHLKIPKMNDLTRKFILHVVNRIDQEIDGRGLMVLFDCTGAGLQNADFDMLWFLVSSLLNYNPKWLNYVLVYELPWILKGAWKVAQGMVPEDQRKLIRFADKSNITDYIARENLPDFMGGTCRINYRRAPKGCITIEELAKKMGVKPDEAEKIRKTYEPYLKEANQPRPKPMVRRQSSLMQFWYFLRRSSQGGPTGPAGTPETIQE